MGKWSDNATSQVEQDEFLTAKYSSNLCQKQITKLKWHPGLMFNKTDEGDYKELKNE